METINMNEFETYIFVHDQNIIIDFENIKKFDVLPNLKYVFLGSGSVDKLKEYGNTLRQRVKNSSAALLAWELVAQAKLNLV